MTASMSWELDREGDASAMEVLAGLQAVQQAVAAEAAATA